MDLMIKILLIFEILSGIECFDYYSGQDDYNEDYPNDYYNAYDGDEDYYAYDYGDGDDSSKKSRFPKNDDDYSDYSTDYDYYQFYDNEIKRVYNMDDKIRNVHFDDELDEEIVNEATRIDDEETDFEYSEDQDILQENPDQYEDAVLEEVEEEEKIPEETPKSPTIQDIEEGVCGNLHTGGNADREAHWKFDGSDYDQETDYIYDDERNDDNDDYYYFYDAGDLDFHTIPQNEKYKNSQLDDIADSVGDEIDRNFRERRNDEKKKIDQNFGTNDEYVDSEVYVESNLDDDTSEKDEL